MNAVAITNIGRDSVFRYCRRSVEPYCKRHGIALELITSPRYAMTGTDGYNYLSFEKNQIARLFDTYDRIVRLDADVIVTSQCPDLLALVPEDKVGAVYEDTGPKRQARRQLVLDAQKELGELGWREGYFNGGVVVVSRRHRELFTISDRDRESIPRWRHIRRSKEQTLLNHRVRAMGFAVHELDFKFNHMSFFSERWNGSPSIRDSYIIHFAGKQRFKALNAGWTWHRLEGPFRKVLGGLMR